MYCLTTKKNKQQISGKYYPIASSKKNNSLIYLEERPFDEYDEKIKLLLNKFIEEKEIPNVYDLILDRKIPRGKYRTIVSEIIDALDDFFSKHIECPETRLQLNPLTRRAVNVYGIAGSGKSYWTAEYIKNCRKVFPDMEVFLITTNSMDDPAYNKLDLQKLSIVDREDLERIADSDINEATFENSMVIFDDIETHDPAIKDFIKNIRDMLFQKSRKHNTEIVNIIHKGLDSHQTIIPNNECTGGVFFPRADWKQIEKILTKYFDCSNKHIKTIKQLRQQSRWVYVEKSYPRYIIFEKGIKIID